MDSNKEEYLESFVRLEALVREKQTKYLSCKLKIYKFDYL